MQFTTRPTLQGTFGMVAGGHYLASLAGYRMLERGGNAVDAGVAAGFCLALLEPNNNGLGGEVPLLVYMADEQRVHAISGQGPAPAAATIAHFRGLGLDLIPGDGLLPACVPAQVDAFIRALSRFGTMTLCDVLEPAIALAEDGFAVYPGLAESLEANADRFRSEWPSSAALYLAGGKPPPPGAMLRNPDWARTLKALCEAEVADRQRGRERALQAARDCFYRGEIAQRLAEFATGSEFPDVSGRPHRGLLTAEDLAAYAGRIEKPVRAAFAGYMVHKCGPWTQGPVFLQQLKLLQGFDLAGLGHNSADALHVIIECAKLAFADREAYYADPDFVAVPLERLLSEEYAAVRRGLVDLRQASLELRPGEVGAGPPPAGQAAGPPAAGMAPGDTTHLDAVDRWGNMLAATPSGGWFTSSPVVPGLGFPLGTRAQMFHLDDRHPERLEPGKRPSTTLTPTIALPDGPSRGPRLAFGTPGGDAQDQWTLQFFLNVVVYGMDLQAAVDAPTVHTAHVPSSFYPHDAYPGRAHVEARVPSGVLEALRARRHEVVVDEPWSHGKVCVVAFDQASRLLQAAASPRGLIGYAVGR